MSAQGTFQCRGSGSNPTSPLQYRPRELVVSPCSLREIRSFIEANHYMGSINGVKVTQCFSVKREGLLVGGLIFGQMATNAWRHYGDSEGATLELRRLFLVDAAGKNSESRVVAFCIRWIKRNLPEVKRIVSYADPSRGHSGGIYLATNFRYAGLSGKDTGFLDPETGRMHHSRALKVKYNQGRLKGQFKPFVKVLRAKKEAGLLVPVVIPQKHCFVFDVV